MACPAPEPLADLTDHAGERVRVRFAVVVTDAPLYAAVDTVKIKSKEG